MSSQLLLEMTVLPSFRSCGQHQGYVPSWSAWTEPLPDGVRLTVTATAAKETAHIRGLGFIGLMASGAHHQPHHLAMAKGEHIH